MGWTENMILAEAAVAYVKRDRVYGDGPARSIMAGNRPEEGDQVERSKKLYLLRGALDPDLRKDAVTQHDKPGKKTYKIIAKFALETGYGNCAEQAAIAFRFLKKETYARSVDIMKVDYVNDANEPDKHNFVVIGRAEGSESRNVASWGVDAVICDPWAPNAPPGLRVYRAKELPAKMRKLLGDFQFYGAVARINDRGQTVY
jgi:hypothetical protein